MNNSLLRLHGLLQAATSANQVASLRSQAAPLLEERLGALSALIEQDASEAISLAFSEDLLAELAVAFPHSVSRLESHGVWQGTLEYNLIDDAQMSKHSAVRRMQTGSEELEIHFSGPEPEGLKTGDVLLARGVRAGRNVAAADGSIVGSRVEAAGCSTTGVQKAAVLLATFPGVAPPSITPQSIYDIFFASTGRSVDGYWKEASYNKASAEGNVYGWYTLDKLYTCDQYSSMLAAAISAADSQVDFRNYNRVFVVFPNPGGCSWAGLGTVGCGTFSSNDGSFTASAAWQLSNYMTTRDQGVKLTIHEGGHGLTLRHASARDFGAEALGALGSAGSLSEYGDVFSAMGSWNLGHYAAQHKLQLGWMTSGASIQTVETNGTFTLEPVEANPAGLQALKIRRGAGNDAWLWVEYRKPTGLYDASLGAQVFTGALIHYQDSQTGARTHLLDFTPETSSWSDPALAATKSWTDPYSNVSLTVISTSSTALTVTVSFGSLPCLEANPTVTVSPANPSVAAGGSVNYTVSVTNNDTVGCAPGTFNVATSLPTSWGSSLSTSSLTVNPGGSGSLTMSKAPPAGTSPGTYAVNSSATKGTHAGTGNANCTVAAPPPPLSASVSIPAGVYLPRSTVSLTATVMSGGLPAAGATVTFNVAKSDGSLSSKTLTTGSNGQAVWNYRVQQKHPKGIQSVTVEAVSGLQSASGGPVTFTVQ